MSIPWKRWGGRLAEWAVTLIRATAPDKGQADPPREPTSTEAFDRWKDGAKVLLAARVFSAGSIAAQAPDSACVATAVANLDSVARLQLPGAELYPTQRRSRERLIDVARARCTPVRPDTVTVVQHDTVVVVRVDTVVVAPPPDSTPVDTVPPVDTIAPPPVDTTGGPGDSTIVLPPPTAPQVAELPRSVPTIPATVRTAPCTQSVVASGLQMAVNQAAAGDVLCLPPGAVFRGTLTLPDRGDSGWVVVRTAPTMGQPAPGERVRPSQRATLATIEAGANNSAVVTAPGARGWALTLLEVTTDSTLSTLTIALIDLQTPPTAAQFARDIAIDRVWAHGWAHRPLRRCVSLQSAATAIVDSWMDDCHEKGSDSQAIAGWSGPGPYLIENNMLAGAGENILFGGATPKFPGTHPSDITIRRNHVHTPISWRGKWTKKNLFELKNARRLLVEQNVFDGSWGDGQTGIAVVIKSANQSGGNSSRDNGTRDLTFRRNLIVNASGAITVNGRGGDAGNIDSLTRRVEITENYADSIGLAATGHDNRGVLILTGATDVLFRRNTWLSPAGDGSAYTGGSVGNLTAVRLTIDGDARTRGRYGVMGCWTPACAPGFASDAALIGGGNGNAPAGFTVFPSLDAALAAGFGISRSTIDAAVAGVVVHP